LVVLVACSRAPGPVLAPPPAAAPVPPAAAPAGAPARPATTDVPVTAPSLPPIPTVDGPLNLRVVYPAPKQVLTVRDSNFIFGSTGSGAAQLTIDGIDVPVFPNGAFLAWLPVPAGDAPRYELYATRGADVASATVPVSLRPLAMPLPDTGPLAVDRGSVTPSGTVGLRGDERARVSARAPANANVVLQLSDGTSRPLVHGAGVAWSTDVNARDLVHAGTIVVHRGRDSVTFQTAAVALM